MSRNSKITLDKLSSFVKSRSPLHLGAIAAGLGAVSVAGYFLAPFLRIELSYCKAWLLSFIYGTKEERLLKHVLANAERGNPKSVMDTIDAWCWSTQWMMNVGDVKGLIVDEQVERCAPKVCCRQLTSWRYALTKNPSSDLLLAFRLHF